MMIRWMYAALLNLHPRSFRERFGEEMIGIFDEHAGRSSGALLLDALFSLFRQWALRPAHAEARLAAVTVEPAIPAFHLLEDSLPRRSALAQGAVLSLIFFAGVTFALGRGGTLPRMLIGAIYPRANVLPVDRSSLSQAEPTTEIKVQPAAIDPLYDPAGLYFGSILVLDVLDANRDRVISPWEIVTAPAALTRLDKDHDGELSAEECGFFTGESREIKLDPEFVGRARKAFMRLNPVLEALDNDHDGAISASEIGRSSVALRTLDRNHDGSLTPVEVLPAGTGIGRR